MVSSHRGAGAKAMKSKILGAAFAAGLLLGASSANAVTFDVNGSSIFGATLTGTIEGDAALTTVTAVNLKASNVINLFNVLNVWTAPLLIASNSDPQFINVYLTFAGGPPADDLAQGQSKYNGAIADVFAAHDPVVCGIDLSCQALVLQERSDAIDEVNQAFADTFYATATAQTPLPAAFPLFAGGLGALGLLGWRRKKKAVL